MQASSQPVKANKPQATTHPHTTNTTKPHITPPQNCPHTKTDNLGYTNCTQGDSHIGLCQTPCPYKAASSASNQKCITSADKLVSSRLWRKRHAKSRVGRLSDVIHFEPEAVGVDVYA